MATSNTPTSRSRPKTWYVRRGHKQAGPVDSTFIIRGAKRGLLLRTDELSKDGKHWRKAGRFKLPFPAPESTENSKSTSSCKPRATRRVTTDSSGTSEQRRAPVPPPIPSDADVESNKAHEPFRIRVDGEHDPSHDQNAELTFEIGKRRFLGSTRAEMILSSSDLRITPEEGETVIVKRQISSIVDRLHFRTAEHTKGLTVILVLIGPVGWIILGVLWFTGMKSPLRVDGKQYVVPAEASKAVEAWGGAGWLGADVKNATKNYGWAGIIWGCVNLIGGFMALGAAEITDQIPPEYRWIVQLQFVESAVVIVLSVAMLIIGVTCIVRKDSEALALDAAVFFCLAAVNGFDAFVFLSVLNSGAQLGPLHSQIVGTLFKCVILCLIQIGIGCSQLRLVRNFRNARRTFNKNEFARYVAANAKSLAGQH